MFCNIAVFSSKTMFMNLYLYNFHLLLKIEKN